MTLTENFTLTIDSTLFLEITLHLTLENRFCVYKIYNKNSAFMGFSCKLTLFYSVFTSTNLILTPTYKMVFSSRLPCLREISELHTDCLRTGHRDSRSGRSGRTADLSLRHSTVRPKYHRHTLLACDWQHRERLLRVLSGFQSIVLWSLHRHESSPSNRQAGRLCRRQLQVPRGGSGGSRGLDHGHGL